MLQVVDCCVSLAMAMDYETLPKMVPPVMPFATTGGESGEGEAMSLERVTHELRGTEAVDWMYLL